MIYGIELPLEFPLELPATQTALKIVLYSRSLSDGGSLLELQLP